MPIPVNQESSSPGRIASMDPVDLDTSADLITILTSPELREIHTGEEWFTICNLPGYLRTLTNNLRLKCEEESPSGVSQPTVSVTLDISIRQGVDDIRTHDDIRAILVLRREIEGCDEWGIREVEMLADWFRSFPFSVPNQPLSRTGKVNIQLTSITKAALITLASDLGISASQLAILAIIQTFSMQDTIFPRTRIKVLESSIDMWFEHARLRRTIGETLFDGMKRLYGPSRKIGVEE